MLIQRIMFVAVSASFAFATATYAEPDSNVNSNLGATNPPKTGSASDVDLGPYMASLHKQIRKTWVRPKGEEGKVVSTIFKIHRNGELTDLRVSKSSGSTISDQAALKAVRDAAPFEHLPAGATDPTEVNYNFSNTQGKKEIFKKF